MADGRIGNEYWKMRAKHGVDKKYTAATLWDTALDYFKWVGENPYELDILVRGEPAKIKKLRPMTLDGLHVHLNITHPTWLEYRKSDDKDLATVTARVDAIVRDNKISGALIEIFNSNLVARLEGLVDKQEVTKRKAVISDKPLTPEEWEEQNCGEGEGDE